MAPAITDEFGSLELPSEYRPRYNIAPSQDVLAVARIGDDHPRVVALRWGLVPFWAESPAAGHRMINARAETLSSRSPFREAFASRRCWVVVDGFYEWQRRERYKAPMRICLQDRRPFVLAGLWAEWGSRREPLRSCTIVTTSYCAALRSVHDRMPVILPRESREAWLNPDAPLDELRDLLQPYERADLHVYEVSPLVNKPDNDVPECIEPAEPEQPTLFGEAFDLP